MIWKARNLQISYDKPLLMGILNLTPDSFSDGGKYLQPDSAVTQARVLVEQGADILDLGAESTRPNADVVSEEEELSRLLPVVEKIAAELQVPISIDTTKPEVAKQCLARGAHIINDVSGLGLENSSKMAAVVRKSGAGFILMHRRGNPRTMQAQSVYQNVTQDVIQELEVSVNRALEWGIEREQLMIDPGLGFAKTAEQNCELIQHLEQFQRLNLPILLGPSRKSFIGHLTGKAVDERVFGTAAVCAIALTKGVSVLRIHDVGPMRDVVQVTEACHNKNSLPLSEG